jgi:hypothetical protein
MRRPITRASSSSIAEVLPPLNDDVLVVDITITEARGGNVRFRLASPGRSDRSVDYGFLRCAKFFTT